MDDELDLLYRRAYAAARHELVGRYPGAAIEVRRVQGAVVAALWIYPTRLADPGVAAAVRRAVDDAVVVWAGRQ